MFTQLTIQAGLLIRPQGLVLLTATPMQVSPIEIWDLLNLLGLPQQWDLSSFRYFFDYKERHQVEGRGQKGNKKNHARGGFKAHQKKKYVRSRRAALIYTASKFQSHVFKRGIIAAFCLLTNAF